MSKKVSIFVAALLIASFSMTANALLLTGSVTQVQSFNIGDALNNGVASVVALTHGQTSGSVIQSLNVNNMQSSPGNSPRMDFSIGFGSCDVEALQCQVANLDQSASATGQCGILNVQTYLDAGGTQNQLIGFSTSTKAQLQSLGVAAQQVLTRADGAGGGVGTNDAFMSQTQVGSNAGGSVFESSTIDALQVSVAGGAANSTAALASTMIATTSQNQQVQ